MCESGALPAHARIRMPAEARTLATVIAQNVRTVATAVADAEKRVQTASGATSTPIASREPQRRGPIRDNRDESIVGHILNLLPRDPAIVSLLSCLVSKRVVDLADDTEDFGARLLFVAASRKHAGLLTALMQAHASISHVDHGDGGFTTLHAVSSNRLVTLDLIQKLLSRSAAAVGLDSDPQHATHVESWLAHVRWLYHVARLHGKVCGAAFALHAWESVHALARIVGLPTAMVASQDASPTPQMVPLEAFLSRVKAPIHTVAVRDAQLLANAASSTMLHVLLEYMHTRVIEPRGEGKDAEVEVTPADALLAMTRGDRFGRTPLHVAALTGNSHAVTLLLRSIGRAAALQYNQSQVLSPTGARVSSLSITVDGDVSSTGMKLHTRAGFVRVREALCGRDVLGFTPIDVALVYSRNDTAELLQASWDALPAELAIPCPAAARPSEVQTPRAASPAAPYAASGGWNDEAALPADIRDMVYALGGDEISFANGCDVDVVDASITPHEFLHTYYARNRPVLIRGLASAWPLRESTAKSVLSDRAGALNFKVSDIPYARSFGRESHIASLDEFVRDAFQPRDEDDNSGRGYIFGTPVVPGDALEDVDASIHPTWASDPAAVSLMQDVPVLLPLMDSTLPVHGDYLASLPAFKAAVNDSEAGARVGLDVNGTLLLPHLSDSIDPLMSPRPYPKPQFYVGDAGSGAPPHVHKDAWNALMHGQKRWYLAPPSMAEYSALPVMDWLRRSAGRSDGAAAKLQCTQNAGDVMYVPHGWGHAVLNVHASVGVAVEFTSALSVY